jgi:hypothetical protein
MRKLQADKLALGLTLPILAGVFRLPQSKHNWLGLETLWRIDRAGGSVFPYKVGLICRA